MVVVGRLDQKMPGPIFCPSPALHAADKNTNCVQHKTDVDRRAHGWAHPRPHAHTTRQNMERECPNPTRNRNSRHECRDLNTTLQHKTRHADERAHFEAARSHENRTWRECQGSVTKPWITLDRSDRTLTKMCYTETAVTISNSARRWLYMNVESHLDIHISKQTLPCRLYFR